MTARTPDRPGSPSPEAPLNIIWLIVDSVRNYRCQAERFDDRGRIEVMDDLTSTWIDFRTVVTSAPSTLMSMGAMFTGRPSYHIGTAFDGLDMSDCGLPTAGSLLGRWGYASYCITRYTLGRECWSSIFEDVPRRYWPRGATHRKQWTNAQANETIFNFVPTIGQAPFFLFVHYTCRSDPLISDHVRGALEFFERQGLMDTSVVLLTSDHGYPDPLRAQQVAARRRELGMSDDEVAHDLVLTDDNVLVPLLLKYPGSGPLRIDQQICTLDYLPTSMELAGLPPEDVGIGTSVVPLLRGEPMEQIESRKIRVDGRFMAQSGRVTAIRSKTRKYVIYPDQAGGPKDEFYDLGKDPLEVKDILKGKLNGYEDEIAEFREAYRRDQDKAHAFIVEFLAEKYRRQRRRALGKRRAEPLQVLYVGIGQALFDELVMKMLERTFPEAELSMALRGDLAEYEGRRSDVVHAAITSKLGNRKLFKKLFRLNTPGRVLIDLCGNVMPLTRLYHLNLLRVLWRNRRWYLQEPMYFFSEIRKKILPGR